MTTPDDQSPRHTRNRRGEGGRLRQDLIDAASRLLSEGASYETLSLRAVARTVGIATTSVYLHFPDKMSLLLAVYQGHFDNLAQRLEDAIAQQPTPAEGLRAAALAYCRFAADQPEAYRVMFSERGSTAKLDEIPAAQRPGYRVIKAVLQVVTSSMEDGSTVAGDPFSATLCLWSALHGLIALRAARPHVAWPPVETLIDALLTTQFVAQSTLPRT
jgi:AcrR family transcriptional regulator